MLVATIIQNNLNAFYYKRRGAFGKVNEAFKGSKEISNI